MIHLAIAQHRCLALAALALPLLSAAPSAAIEFAPPAPGHRFEYACNSNIPNPINPARTAEIEIKQIDAGMVTYATLINGSPRMEIRQPLSLYGTSLADQITTRQGSAHVVSGLDKFPSLHDLEVGATYEGKVEWVNERGKHITYDVTLAISEESEYRSNPFGYIPVIVIEETWKGPRTNVTSKTFISPERSAVVSWVNEIGKYGVEECWLTGVSAP
jgi:hypothetical protein